MVVPASSPVASLEGSRAGAPRCGLGLIELVGAGGAFIAPAFSLAAIFPLLALSGGGFAPEGVLLGTLVALLAAGCFARMSQSELRAGGAYAFVRSEFPPEVAFVAGWGLALLYLLGPAIPLFLFAECATLIFPGLAPFFVLLAVLVAASVFVVNVLGLRPSTRVALALFAVESAVLVGVAVILLARPGVAPPSTTSAPWLAVGSSGAAAVFLFLGFESVSVYSEEAHLPQRDVARGTLVAITLAAGVYVLSAMAYLHAVPATQWQGGDLVTAVGGTLGPQGGELFLVVILVSSLGTLIAVENACARILFAMARDGIFPRPLTRLRGSERAPWVPLGVTAVVTSALVAVTVWRLPFVGSWSTGFVPWVLPGLVVVGALVAYVLVSLAYAKAALRIREARPRAVALSLAGSSLALTGSLLVLQVLPSVPESTAVIEGALLWIVLGAVIWGATCWTS